MEEDQGEYNLQGALRIGDRFYSYVDDLQKKVFDGANKQDIHLFAMAVGIQLGLNLEESEWSTSSKKDHPGSQLAQYNSVRSILDTLRCLGMLDSTKSPLETLSEYTNGGLSFLKEIQFEEQSEDALYRFFEKLPHLAPSEE